MDRDAASAHQLDDLLHCRLGAPRAVTSYDDRAHVRSLPSVSGPVTTIQQLAAAPIRRASTVPPLALLAEGQRNSCVGAESSNQGASRRESPRRSRWI